MSTYKAPVIGRMASFCEVCGRRYPRADLVLQTQECTELQGENKFTYSRYSSSGWACSASDGGMTSAGTQRGLYMNTPGLSTTSMEQPALLGGIQTWSGDGTLRSTVAVDASAATNICVSAYIGPKQDSVDPAITVVMGFCNSSGTVLTTERTWQITGTTRVWFSTPRTSVMGATTSALYAYFAITNTDEWWASEMQFEDAEKPGTYVETTGAAKTQAEARVYQGKRVCKECRKPKWNLNPGVTKVEPPDKWETWGL